jgi:hypothetical protein
MERKYILETTIRIRNPIDAIKTKLNVNNEGLTRASSASNIGAGGTAAVTTGGASGTSLSAANNHNHHQALSLTNLSSMLLASNVGAGSGTNKPAKRRSLYVRALFNHDPTRDSGIPGKGLEFAFGDILHVVNACDEEWWQAKHVISAALCNGDDGGADEPELGIIPSRRRVERRERARQRRVNFGKSLVLEHNGSVSIAAVDKTDPPAASTSTSKKRTNAAVGVLKIFKKNNKKETQSNEDLSDQESVSCCFLSVILILIKN